MAESLSPEELEALQSEAAAIAEPTFTDSQGSEREYPEGLAVEDRDEYQAFVEQQIEANRHNHDKPVVLVSPRDYDAIAGIKPVDNPPDEVDTPSQ